MNRQEMIGNFIFELFTFEGGNPKMCAEALRRVTEYMGEHQQDFCVGVSAVVMGRAEEFDRDREEEDTVEVGFEEEVE